MTSPYQNAAEIKTSTLPRPPGANGQAGPPTATSDHGANIYDDLDSPVYNPLPEVDTSDYAAFDPNTYSDTTTSVTLPLAARGQSSVTARKSDSAKTLDNRLCSIRVTPVKLVLFIITVLGCLSLSAFVGFFICHSQVGADTARGEVTLPETSAGQTSGPVGRIRGGNTSDGKAVDQTGKGGIPDSRSETANKFSYDGTLKVRFRKAEEFCVKQGKRLVRLVDPKTELELGEFLDQHGLSKVWLGSQVISSRCGGLQWCEDSKDAPRYTHWRQRLARPSLLSFLFRGKCTCVVFTSEGWETRDCSAREHFVCHSG